MFLPVHYYSLFPATLQIVHHLTYLSCFYLYAIIHYFLPHYPFDLFIMFLPVRYYSLFPATLQIVHHLVFYVQGLSDLSSVYKQQIILLND